MLSMKECPLYDLLLAAGMDEATTTGVAVFSPDGFSYVMI